MRAKYLLAFSILVVSSLATQIAHATVYNLVNQGIDPATATGTITTDGTIGVLSQSNITGLDILVSDGTNSFTLTLPDLLLYRRLICLRQRAESIFDYLGVDGGSLLALNVGAAVNAYCAASAGGLPCFDGGTLSTEGLAVARRCLPRRNSIGRSANCCCRRDTQKSSTWAMMILGFVGVGFMAYRRSNRPVDGLA